MNVEDAHPSVEAAAGAGPHGNGWNTFDLKLEGARFHLLQQAVEAPRFDAALAERLVAELEALAQSYGYATADSYLADAHGLSDEEIRENPVLSSLKENLFDEDGHEDQYFIEVRTSERILFPAAATPEAAAFLTPPEGGMSQDGSCGTVFARMHRAFIAGRDMRADQDSAPKPMA